MPNDDEVFTVSGAASELGMSYNNTLRWIRDGQLKARRLKSARSGEEHQYIITRADLEEFRKWWNANPNVQKGLASQAR